MDIDIRIDVTNNDKHEYINISMQDDKGSFIRERASKETKQIVAQRLVKLFKVFLNNDSER